MIPIMDGMKEYLGMMHELPDFVQINRVSVCVCVCVCVFVRHQLSHLMIEVQVGPQVPTPSSMRHVQPSWRAPVPSPGGFACTDS